MKNRLCLVGVLTSFASSPVFAEDAYVTVNLTNGSKYSYLLSESPKITYSNDSLLVSGPASTRFLLDEVDSYNFTETDLSKVQLIGKKEIRISFVDNNHVKAEGLEPKSPVSLFSSTGRTIKQIKATENGLAELELPQAKGVYILKTNDQTVKLVK